MASGEAVRILSTGYTFQPLTNVCPDCLGIVVGPADLSSQSIVNRLQAAYNAGQPVGLTNATAVSIQRLHDLLAHRGSAEPVPGGATTDLVAFRKAFRADGQLHSSSHLLLPRAVTTPSSLTVNLQSSVPIPFGTTFSLQQPSVTGLNPTSVDQGDTFTINGSGLYPSLVQAVLIGGTALNADNISTVSDTQINVVAPAFNNCAQGCSVVVQTAQGTSNDNVTISIIPNP